MDNRNIFDRGVAKVKDVVSEVSIEQRGFMKTFMRLCQDGWQQGWHEANGGNLSYRMTPEEASASRSYFNEVPGEWMPLEREVPNLTGEFFVVTGSGEYFRAVSADLSGTCGIIEIGPSGNAWRLVWGLKQGKRPTSELAGHLTTHSIRFAATQGVERVVYHTHPAHVIALGHVLPADSKVLSRALWESLTESILMIPQGVAVVPWCVPGSARIAEDTGEAMKSHNVVLWPHHGLICSTPDCSYAFGMVETVEKAARIHLLTRSASGGSTSPRSLSDDDIRAAARSFGVIVKEAYLG